MINNKNKTMKKKKKKKLKLVLIWKDLINKIKNWNQKKYIILYISSSIYSTCINLVQCIPCVKNSIILLQHVQNYCIVKESFCHLFLTTWLKGFDFENSPWTTGPLAGDFRETTAAHFRSLCTLLWPKPSASQPLHRTSVESSCDAVWERNGTCWAKNSWQA